jgi:hypothetical protein
MRARHVQTLHRLCRFVFSGRGRVGAQVSEVEVV